jgi:hypothetical protein
VSDEIHLFFAPLTRSRGLIRHDKWLDPSRICPLASIRYYLQITWQSVKHEIGIPRLVFASPTSSAFQFDGVWSSADRLSNTCFNLYHRMKQILQQDLLLGLSEHDFGQSDIGFYSIVDKLTERQPGYGFLLSAKLRKGLSTLQVFMDNPKTKGHFQTRNGSSLIFNARSCRKYLQASEQFKQLMYALIHTLAGMPKRSSEERRFKIFNTTGQLRNLFNMLNRLAIIGNYSKTSALSEFDRASLHFVPECIADLIIRYFSRVADVEKIFVKMFCPNRKENYECYLFSSFGQRWKKDRLSSILKREMGFTVGQLRHIIPGILDQYGLDAPLRTLHDSVVHKQKGHSRGVAGRLYSRTIDLPSKLTNSDIHDALFICERWEGFMGFSGTEPKLMTEESMLAFAMGPAHEEERELTRAVRELLAKLEVLTPLSKSTVEEVSSAQEKFGNIEKIVMSDRRSVTSSSTAKHHNASTNSPHPSGISSSQAGSLVDTLAAMTLSEPAFGSFQSTPSTSFVVNPGTNTPTTKHTLLSEGIEAKDKMVVEHISNLDDIQGSNQSHVYTMADAPSGSSSRVPDPELGMQSGLPLSASCITIILMTKLQELRQSELYLPTPATLINSRKHFASNTELITETNVRHSSNSTHTATFITVRRDVFIDSGRKKMLLLI